MALQANSSRCSSTYISVLILLSLMFNKVCEIVLTRWQ
jgi:hypothetical protein